MKSIIVTGASKGIGYQTALHLAKTGNRVIAVARSEEKLKDLNSKSDSIIPLSIDISSSDGIEKLSRSASDLGEIHGLVNNAGLLINKPFADTDLEDWQSTMAVNVFAPALIIRSVKPLMKKGSHIVNIGSMGGYQGSDKFPGLSAYSASKGALSILTESLSREFNVDGISVNCLCLGAVQTEMLEQAFPGFQAPVTSEEMGAFIADFVLFKQNFFNGKILPVALNNPG